MKIIRKSFDCLDCKHLKDWDCDYDENHWFNCEYDNADDYDEEFDSYKDCESYEEAD